MHITMRNLSKRYITGKKIKTEVHAVKDISLEIPSNKIFGIIGKSGAGKSTLVRLVSLLERTDAGEIYYNDKRVDNLEGKDLINQRRRLGMIFQNFNLFSSRTAIQNIAYPLEIIGTPKDIIEKRTRELIELVGLSDRAEAPVSTLSGGQKQRIAIARALANKPDILFCDEATSALDPQTTLSILNLIRKIQQKMNLTVVMITHQMEVVRDACELVAVVHEGEIVEQGTVDDIFLHPETDTTRDFLSNLSQPVEKKVKESQPEIVRWSENSGEYILRFIDAKTDEPVISRISQKFDIEINIRAAGIQQLHNAKVGTLDIDISGNKTEIEKTVKYLKESGIVVEKQVKEADND